MGSFRMIFRISHIIPTVSPWGIDKWREEDKNGSREVSKV